MLRCLRCKQTYEESEANWRYAVLGDCLAAGTHVAVCPFCGSDDNEEIYDNMSVDLWAWHEECDSHKCVGDCDLCEFWNEEEEEGEE